MLHGGGYHRVLPEMMAQLISMVAQIMMGMTFRGISRDEGSNLTHSTRTTTAAMQTLKCQ